MQNRTIQNSMVLASQRLLAVKEQLKQNYQQVEPVKLELGVVYTELSSLRDSRKEGCYSNEAFLKVADSKVCDETLRQLRDTIKSMTDASIFNDALYNKKNREYEAFKNRYEKDRANLIAKLVALKNNCAVLEVKALSPLSADDLQAKAAVQLKILALSMRDDALIQDALNFESLEREYQSFCDSLVKIECDTKWDEKIVSALILRAKSVSQDCRREANALLKMSIAEQSEVEPDIIKILDDVSEHIACILFMVMRFRAALLKYLKNLSNNHREASSIVQYEQLFRVWDKDMPLGDCQKAGNAVDVYEQLLSCIEIEGKGFEAVSHGINGVIQRYDKIFDKYGEYPLVDPDSRPYRMHDDKDSDAIKRVCVKKHSVDKMELFKKTLEIAKSDAQEYRSLVLGIKQKDRHQRLIDFLRATVNNTDFWARQVSFNYSFFNCFRQRDRINNVCVPVGIAKMYAELNKYDPKKNNEITVLDAIHKIAKERVQHRFFTGRADETTGAFYRQIINHLEESKLYHFFDAELDDFKKCTNKVIPILRFS